MSEETFPPTPPEEDLTQPQWLRRHLASLREQSSLPRSESPPPELPSGGTKGPSVSTGASESSSGDISAMEASSTPAPSYPPSQVDTLLADRATTHGDIRDNAHFTFGLLELMEGVGATGFDGWSTLTREQKLVLLMIQHKIGRILSGNAYEVDHWKDIAGYATLIVKILEKRYP